MPGFNLYSSAIKQHSNETYDFDKHSPIEWMDEDDFKLNSQTPANYPKNHSPSPLGYLEGVIYSDDVESNLKDLYRLLDAGKLDQSKKMVQSWDGEFVVIYVTNDKIYIVSDGFGRLPVYYSNLDDNYIVSRNISFIRSFSKSEDYDRMQVGVSLLFGTQLGESTPWKSIRKAPPHSILEITRSTNTLKVHRYFKFKTLSGDATIEEKNEEIRSTFIEAVQNRVKCMIQPTLSLSGGMDSRLIAATLKYLDTEIPHITYSRDNNADHLDYVSSKEITQQLDKAEGHEIVRLGTPTTDSAQELLKIKQGFNFLSMSYIIPYYELHKERGISTITGDGGGIYLGNVHPLRDLQSMDQLIDYISCHNAFCDFATAAGIAGISAAELRAYVVNHLTAYPFDDFNDKFTYFIFREIGINWAFEGEDRNRQYCWSSSPFYHPKLIELCLSVPQISKAYGGLFKPLYASLPGNLAAVSNPNWNVTVDDLKSVRSIYKRQKLKSYVPAFLLNRKNGVGLDAFVFSDKFKALKSNWTGDQLDLSQLKSKHSMNFYWQLYTLMKLMSGK